MRWREPRDGGQNSSGDNGEPTRTETEMSAARLCFALGAVYKRHGGGGADPDLVRDRGRRRRPRAPEPVREPDVRSRAGVCDRRGCAPGSRGGSSASAFGSGVVAWVHDHQGTGGMRPTSPTLTTRWRGRHGRRGDADRGVGLSSTPSNSCSRPTRIRWMVALPGRACIASTEPDSGPRPPTAGSRPTRRRLAALPGGVVYGFRRRARPARMPATWCAGRVMMALVAAHWGCRASCRRRAGHRCWRQRRGGACRQLCWRHSSWRTGV